MAHRQSSAVDTFPINSILFIAPAEVDGERYCVFQFEDGIQNYYAIPTEAEKVAMSENARRTTKVAVFYTIAT